MPSWCCVHGSICQSSSDEQHLDTKGKQTDKNMPVWRLIFANTSRWYCTYNSLLNNSIRRSPRRITTINPTVLVWYTRNLFYRNKTELAVINAILEIQYQWCIRNEFWLKSFFNYGKDYTNWRHGSCVHFDETYFSINSSH